MSSKFEAMAAEITERLAGHKLAFNVSRMNPKVELLSVMAFNSRGALVHSKAYDEETVDQIVSEIEESLAPWA